jgi:large subunit ribosomal protein L10
MAKTRQQKETEVKNLSDKLTQTKSIVFADFKGLKVSETTTLRRECRAKGVDYVVAKKTLLKKALANAGINDFDPKSLVGSFATFLSQDEVAPAKVLSQFAKQHENLKISGGLMDKKVVDLAMIKSLAQLPGKEELLAKVVGSLAAPLFGLVHVLQGNLCSLVYVLSALRDKKQ